MTTPRDCDICGGRQVVTLAIQRRAAVVSGFNGTEPPKPELLSRSYPCPNCVDLIPVERIATVSFHAVMDSRITDPDYERHAKASAAHSLIDGIVKNNLIQYRKGSPQGLRIPMIATVMVAAPHHVATMEQRIAEHQEIVAREVIEEAAKHIMNWGSYYGEQQISKGEAITGMHDALRTVINNRKAQAKGEPDVTARR